MVPGSFLKLNTSLSIYGFNLLKRILAKRLDSCAQLKVVKQVSNGGFNISSLHICKGMPLPLSVYSSVNLVPSLASSMALQPAR